MEKQSEVPPCSPSRPLEERILILAPTGRDATLTGRILAEAGLQGLVCAGMTDLLEKLEAGAGALLLTEEALPLTARQTLGEILRAQPAWSDLPLILLLKGRRADHRRQPAGRWQDLAANVTLLDRPVAIPTLTSVAQTALRARRRQYEVRALLDRLADQNRSLEQEIVRRRQTQADLQRLNAQLEQRVAKRTNALQGTNRALQAKIAARKQTERKLAEERRLLRTLIDNSPDYIYVKDAESRFLLGNVQVVRVMGAESEADLLGKTDFDFYPPTLAGRYYADDQRVIQTGRPLIDWEEPLTGPAGNRRWLSTTKAPLRDEQGRVTGLVGIGRDITRRKQIAQALQDSEERFRKVFEEGPLGMAIIGRDYRYLQVNARLSALLEYSAAELQQRTPFDVTHPEDVVESRVLSDQIFRGNVMDYRLEKRYITKSNQVVWVSLSASVIRVGEAEGAMYGLGMIEDITARKKMELERLALLRVLRGQHEQLRALTTQLAEAQESERRRLARELHDKVGQLLTAINLNLGYVFTRMPVDFPEAAMIRPRLETAMQLVGETTDHIRDVMADLRPSLLDEAGLVPALEWYAGRFAVWAGVTVVVEGDSLTSRPAGSVETTLFRISQEALNNVAKHAQASRVVISIQAEEETIRLTIADDGVGFSPPDLSDYDPQRNRWGLLTMVERAEMVEGRCRVESQPGQGTQVLVEVPRAARSPGS